MKTAGLPLLSATPPAWTRDALADPLALLNDHAHLEKKAAGNALELLDRWPEPEPPAFWVEKMVAVARDEIDHLGRVARLLARRGGRLSKHHRNPYANALRAVVRLGDGPRELMDRLMVSALIEARSCERFAVLAEHCDDAELAGLYADLWTTEHGHYRIFLELARQLPAVGDEVAARWEAWLTHEAAVLAEQPRGARLHSGWSS